MAILRQSRLCRNLEEKELLNLMEQEGTVRTYSRGERIFQETDRPDSVYMLLNGSVIIAKETFSGKRILLGAAGRSRGSVRGGLCLYGESFL